MLYQTIVKVLEVYPYELQSCIPSFTPTVTELVVYSGLFTVSEALVKLLSCCKHSVIPRLRLCKTK